MDGVLDTRSSWVGGHEVVEVAFDPRRVEYADLLDQAIDKGCANHAWATSKTMLATAKERLGNRATKLESKPRRAQDSDQLFYLGRSPHRYVPLTPLQARRINGVLGSRGSAGGKTVADFMSPRQTETLGRIQRALQKNRSALDGLERPDDRRKLGAYTRALDESLRKAGV